MATKSERLRFTNEDDLVLLREVTSLNPYEDKETWKTIAERVGAIANKNFSIRAVRDHVENLLKNWIKTNRANLKKSGIEEEYTEKEQLLQEIEDLQREYKGIAASKKSNNSNLQNRGIQARDIALRNVNLSETTSELEFQELLPSISLTNAPSSPTFSPLSLSPATLQQDFVPSTYSTDILSINTETHHYSPGPILSPQLAPSPGPIPSPGPVPLSSPRSILSQSSGSVPSPSPLLSASRTPLSTLQTGPIRNIRNKVRGGLKNSTLHFLEDKHHKDIQLEKQKLQIEGEKLQLEGEKLQLEKAKFELERKERETRLELESEERRHSIVVAAQQKHLMEILLHLIDKSKT